ncbi:MAG: hypothetical protein AAF682_27255 [Planctomycetota bacterium]
MTCPSYDQLFLLLSGTDAGQSERPADLATAQEHLDGGCPLCVRRVRLVRLVLGALAVGEFPQVPEAWSRQVEALASPGREAAPFAPVAPLSRVRQFVAQLVLDAGLTAEPALALRGEGPAERHLLYQAGPFEVDLALLESGALVGQVLSAEEESPSLDGCICMLHGEDESRQTPLDDNGDFHFSGVQPSAYDLVLEGPEVRVLVPGIELGADEPNVALE